MLIEDRFFTQDKNYLLKSVQAFSKDLLIKEWVEALLAAYKQEHNPMGLMDDFMLELEAKICNAAPLLLPNYDILAAIYRLRFGDNQLSFQWDGRSHMEVYDTEWKIKYRSWINELSSIKEIQRAAVKYAISFETTNTDFLQGSLRRGIINHFRIRLRASRLQELSA